MLISHKRKETISLTCTDRCYMALNSGKGLLSCEERRLCISVMQNNAESKQIYNQLASQVDVEKLIAEGYLAKSNLTDNIESMPCTQQIETCGKLSDSDINPIYQVAAGNC